jgi:PAS domain S-box-containing protein
VSSWLREGAGILALAPAVLVYGSGRLKEWVGQPAEYEWPRIGTRDVLKLGLEIAAWSATLWLSVQVKSNYDLNITYLTFIPVLALTLQMGMRLAVLALAANAVAATTLWTQLHWGAALSMGDLRLLIAIYSMTILVLAAVVDERQHGRMEINERKQAEAALRESEQQLVSIYNTVKDVIFCLVAEPDGQFRFLSVNKAFLRVTGLSREAVVGKTVNEVIPGPSLSMVLGKYRQAIEEHAVVVWEETSDYPTGRLTGEVSVAPVFDNEGKCTHLVGSVHDITELKRAQEQAFARQKLETLGTLANGIAHDFNNILGGVLAQADLALTDLDSGSARTEELNAIRDAAIRGAGIVRELLIYAGTESPALMPLDVSQVVEEMLGLLKVSVSKHARIETELGKDLPAVRANPAQISQLLMNLVTNASDAIGDRSGMIRVLTRRVTAGSGVPGRRLLTERDYLQLEVSDTGCGISAETQARVFEPFFSTKSTGRGIGLAVVDGIVRNLGGVIHVESELGKGTTIRISLPPDETDSKAVDSGGFETGEEPQQSRGSTVLVVEDEAPLRQAVSKMLGKKGARVIEAADGGTALDAIRTQQTRIDVVVLDITIPGASSREVFEEAIRLRPELRVIVTSAYSEDVAVASLQHHFQHFLRKPYRLSDLLGLIQTVE